MARPLPNLQINAYTCPVTKTMKLAERNGFGGQGRTYKLVKVYSDKGSFAERNEFGGVGRRYNLKKVYA